MTRGVALLLAALLAPACSAAPAAPAATVPPAAPQSPASPQAPATPVTVTRLRPEPLSFTYNSGLTRAQRLVVRDEATWRELWASIWRGGSVPPLPPVDFTREMLIVAALGQQPTGGHGIFVDGASAAAGGLAVRIRTVSPGPQCATSAALTEPVDIARLPRHDGPVTFEERAETQECR